MPIWPVPPDEPRPADSPAASGVADGDELARLKRALWQGQRDARLGRLLATVAHDLNNPLTVILGRSELMADDADRPAAVRSGALRIADAARRCATLVTGMLGLAGRGRPQAPGMAELVNGLLPLLAQGLQKDGIRLSLQLDDTLAPVGGDAVELAHAVLALLDNARHALASSDTAPRQITIRSGQHAERLGWQWLCVSDNGPGVPDAIAGQMFEAFFSTRPDAAGLGLTMARDAALALGGDLVLEPISGGASFRLSWPSRQ